MDKSLYYCEIQFPYQLTKKTFYRNIFFSLHSDT